MYNIGLANLHPFLPIPVSNLLALPITRFTGQNLSGSVTALIDSGATHSLISTEIVQQYGLLLETRD